MRIQQDVLTSMVVRLAAEREEALRRAEHSESQLEQARARNAELEAEAAAREPHGGSADGV